ncbi:MAG: hypothetical protein ACOX8C_05470 [Saccharomonospora viridis]|jgi:hypothetical protein|uniref:hypothetical protein n=1 Tax=Saccharomonospora viridis TaxID=1852 RepID=UPI003D8A97C6
MSEASGQTWRLAKKSEVRKAMLFDIMIAFLFYITNEVLISEFVSFVVSDTSHLMGLLLSMFLYLFLSAILLALAIIWVTSNFVNQFRSVGYRRYNLYMVYGDTGSPVGFGGVIIGIILAPIDLTFLIFKANARQIFFWARNVQVIYVPPGGDFPDGPLPRKDPFPPVEPDPDSLLER